MFDISWTEFLLIGVVALIAIGPKELPGVLRTAGQWMGKVRRMAAEFQGQFQEALREANMADLKDEVDAIRNTASNFASSLTETTPRPKPSPPPEPSTPESSTPIEPSTPTEAISGAPPPLLAESPAAEAHSVDASADATATPPAPASTAPAPPPEAAPAALTPAPAPSVDVQVPLPEPLPPVTSADFAAAPTIDAPAIEAPTIHSPTTHSPATHPPKTGEGA